MRGLLEVKARMKCCNSVRRFEAAMRAFKGWRPRIAVMGRKDYEALERMTVLVDDLHRPILCGVALERESGKRSIEVI